MLGLENINVICYESDQAIGHGVSSSFIDKVREVAEKFISLPLEEKQKSLRAAGESEGFGGNTVVSQNQVLDWCNRLSLQVFPEHKRRLNLWPLKPHDFGFVINKTH